MAFWGNREKARQKQIEAGKADQGERAGVTLVWTDGGKIPNPDSSIDGKHILGELNRLSDESGNAYEVEQEINNPDAIMYGLRLVRQCAYLFYADPSTTHKWYDPSQSRMKIDQDLECNSIKIRRGKTIDGNPTTYRRTD